MVNYFTTFRWLASGHWNTAASSSVNLATWIWSVVLVQVYWSSCETAVDIWTVGICIVSKFISWCNYIVHLVGRDGANSQPDVVAHCAPVPWWYYWPVRNLHVLERVSNCITDAVSECFEFYTVQLYTTPELSTEFTVNLLTSSVAAGFGRHGMPPPACNDTQVQHLMRWDACDLELWPWNWCAMSHVCAQCHTCRGVPSCQFWLFVSDLWAIGRWARRLIVSGRGEVSSLLINQPAANCCCLQGWNWQITVFWRQNSRFRKLFSKICSITMLRSLIRILQASLVQTDTEMAEKYANNGMR